MKKLRPVFKRALLIVGIIALTVQLLSAQPQQRPQKEKVEAMRIAFITKRLDLTPEEAKGFWPVYNGYRKDLATLRHNFYPKSDSAESHLDADRQLEFEQKKLDLKKQYKSQFEAVIGKAKVNLLISAEEDFKKLLVQTIRNRQQRRGGAGWR